MASSVARSAATNVVPLPETSSESASCIQNEGIGSSCKSQLQTYAQKRNLNYPSYECIREGSLHAYRYKAKVTVDGQTFESSQSFNLLKEAENAAARIALMSLSVDGDYQDTIMYKNLLLELTQKGGLSPPVYENSMDGPSHMPVFSSSVEVKGEKFSGIAAKTKKQAEQNAAKVAWCMLKERKSSRHTNLIPSFEVCQNVKIATSGAVSAAADALLPQQSPRPETLSGSASCIQPKDCREGSSESCTGVGTNCNASSMVSDCCLQLAAKCNVHSMVSGCRPQEAAKSSVDNSGSQSENVCAAAMKESLGPPLDPVELKKLVDVIAKGKESHGAPLTPVKRESHANVDGKVPSTLICCRIQVYPRTAQVVLPAGGHLLPFSDDKWVAVGFDSSNI